MWKVETALYKMLGFQNLAMPDTCIGLFLAFVSIIFSVSMCGFIYSNDLALYVLVTN